VHYKKGTRLIEEMVTISDDWVIDMYGKELAKKLIDCDENAQFIMPIAEDGRLAMIKVDECKITRVKYIPPKYVHETDARGNNHVTTDACTKCAWKGLLEDYTSLTIWKTLLEGSLEAGLWQSASSWDIKSLFTFRLDLADY
jgi:hypothetical protein